MMMMYTPQVLPRLERALYWIIGIGSIVYAIYNLHLESERYLQLHGGRWNRTFNEGWMVSGRKQDLNDAEFSKWRKLTADILIYYGVHIVLYHLSYQIFKNHDPCKMIVMMFDCCVIHTVLGYKGVLVLVAEASVMYCATVLNSVALIWGITICLIWTENSSDLVGWRMRYIFVEYDAFYLFIVAEAFLLLRWTSFAIEKIYYNRKTPLQKINELANYSKSKVPEQNHENNGIDARTIQKDNSVETLPEPNPSMTTLHSDPTFLDLMYYTFCLPCFFAGPVVNYEDFHTQHGSCFNKGTISLRYTNIAQRLLRIGFWYFFLEFQFHFLYFSAISKNYRFVETMPLSAVVALGYYQGQFFMVKYLCMYGLGHELLRFEGLQPYSWPRCISWVYSYSDQWKYFDVGLYKFMKKHIYVALGGSRCGLGRQVLASTLVFAFIFYWHGAYSSLSVFVLGNFVNVILETVGGKLMASRYGEQLGSSFGNKMMCRLKGMLQAVNFIVCCIYTFYFFFGNATGKAIKDKMLFGVNCSWTSVVLEWIFFYCNVQNAIWIKAQLSQCPVQKKKD